MDLRHHLRKCRVRQRQLAARLAVSEATVSKWLTGKQAIPATSIRPLAAALGISTDDLLREIEGSDAKPEAA